MSSVDPDRIIRSVSAQPSAVSDLESGCKPSIYADVPALLRPPAPGCPHVTDEELATVLPMKKLPPALVPTSNSLPPMLELGFPITLEQIVDICAQWNPDKPLSTFGPDGRISRAVGSRIHVALSKRCQYPVQLSTVVNHPGENFITLGDNYDSEGIRQVLRPDNIREFLGYPYVDPLR
ncbi:hypothetical protein EWM64_g1622 [Hericium alpestre]|uniref:Uncharacterized protein n=1 Tax=Hericium alpestre TaxID=135208 RepID=A0A4Z0A7C6_9AGAM|nr:hypothetical protein EWM64_g1622 [Hericium alpestre]